LFLEHKALEVFFAIFVLLKKSFLVFFVAIVFVA